MDLFGIDFGTTNSCAFELDSELAFGDEENRPLPSIIAIDKATDQPEAGRRIWNNQLALSQDGNHHVISSVKSLLDTDREWPGALKRWNVPEVAAVVLKQLSNRARARGVSGGIKEAVFSVPVGMSPKARRNLRKAAQIAGIKVSAFVKESTAALIRSWDEVKNCRFVVVFDWGGGTLDISVLELKSGQIQELATECSRIAGDIIDEDLMKLVHGQIMKRRNSSTDLKSVPENQRDQLRYRCEAAKCALADPDKAEYNFALLGYDGANEERVTLTRPLCQPIIEPRVIEALKLLDKAIRRAGLSTEAIDQIRVIGGCSKLWLLDQMIREHPHFGAIRKIAPEPEWDVAHGAAMLQKNPGCFSLGETLALQLSDGTGFELFSHGDRAGDNARSVSLALVEDVRSANIVIERSIDDHVGGETLLQFAIQTRGFDLEEIRLDCRLTDDLTLEVTGQSASRPDLPAVHKETGELRFVYDTSIAS